MLSALNSHQGETLIPLFKKLYIAFGNRLWPALIEDLERHSGKRSSRCRLESFLWRPSMSSANIGRILPFTALSTRSMTHSPNSLGIRQVHILTHLVNVLQSLGPTCHSLLARCTCSHQPAELIWMPNTSLMAPQVLLSISQASQSLHHQTIQILYQNWDLESYLAGLVS